jgi:predicted ATP-grasp superfamily ATP-dependent carboligase
MYTGALENHPALVDRLAAVRPLWGNPGEVLRQVRNPWRVREALVTQGLLCPALGDRGENLAPGIWLRKPLRSAGGGHIEVVAIDAPSAFPLRGEGGRSLPASPSHYYQEHIPGEPRSAVYVAANGTAILLGVTRQLSGAEWTGAQGFQYAGSLGPLILSEAERRVWSDLGACLAQQFALTGLFGVDAICNAQGIYPVEVNPRYTASVEILERAMGIWAIQWHAAACETGTLPSVEILGASGASTSQPTRTCGKAILFARRDDSPGEWFWRWIEESNTGAEWPNAADLPHRGQVFRKGEPLLTVFAEGVDAGAVESQLHHTAQRVFALVEGRKPW